MEAGNRVIVRPDAEQDALADRADASSEALGRLRIEPSGWEWPAQPRASPGEDAK